MPPVMDVFDADQACEIGVAARWLKVTSINRRMAFLNEPPSRCSARSASRLPPQGSSSTAAYACSLLSK